MGWFKKWILLLILLDIGMVVWRWTSTGNRHALLARIQALVTVQIAMSIVSSIMYNRCSGCPANQSPSRLLLRLVTILFLVLTHTAWLFFYVYLPDNSSLASSLAVTSFLCVSVYVHFGSFLIGFLVVEKALDYLLPTVRNPVLKSKCLHTAVAILLAVSFTLLGVASTSQDIAVRRVDVTLPDLSPSFDGFKLALMTDLHIGPTVGRSRVEVIVGMVNGLDADAIAIVGDLVDGFVSNLGTRALPLAELKSKHGVFFATGNHEYYHDDVDQWVDFFRNKLNLNVLRNEHHVIRVAEKTSEMKEPKDSKDKNGLDLDSLCIIGVDDLITEKLFIPGHKMNAIKAVEGCPLQSMTILLAHQPNAARKVIDSTNRDFHLILSGHTHGGQFYVFWPVAYLQNAFLHGLYRDYPSGTQVYVSSGVNYWGPPVKIWNTCEIVVISLRRGQTTKVMSEFNKELANGIGGSLP